MGHYREARPSDAIKVAKVIRPEDRAECMAVHGTAPEIMLPLALSGGTENRWAMVDDDGEPFGLLGVDPLDSFPAFGLVWLVSSPVIFDYRRQFLRGCRPMLDTLHDRFPVLGNHVDERNTKHIRWLSWLGFSFLRRHPQFGVEQRPFLEFARIDTRECALQQQR